MEINQLIESLKKLAVEQFPEDDNDTFPLEMMDLVKDTNDSVDLETFLMWAVKQNSLRHLLDMLHQVMRHQTSVHFLFIDDQIFLVGNYSCVTSYLVCGLVLE